MDVASQRGNRIYPNASNFVYSRVTSLRAVSGTARLFAVPNTMLLYPTKVAFPCLQRPSLSLHMA